MRFLVQISRESGCALHPHQCLSPARSCKTCIACIFRSRSEIYKILMCHLPGIATCDTQAFFRFLKLAETYRRRRVLMWGFPG